MIIMNEDKSVKKEKESW